MFFVHPRLEKDKGLQKRLEEFKEYRNSRRDNSNNKLPEKFQVGGRKNNVQYHIAHWDRVLGEDMIMWVREENA
jgi:hypothetical protein